MLLPQLLAPPHWDQRARPAGELRAGDGLLGVLGLAGELGAGGGEVGLLWLGVLGLGLLGLCVLGLGGVVVEAGGLGGGEDWLEEEEDLHCQ